MEIKNLILDLGGVLFDLDYEATRQEFLKLGFDQQYSKLAQANIFDELEEGKVTADDFYDFLISNSINNPKPTKLELKNAWNKMLLSLKQDKLDLLVQLKKKYNLFLFSNTNEIHIEAVWETINKEHQLPNLNDYFDKIYLSHEMGIRKPKEEGFDQIVLENGLNKQATLFIDDSPQHVQGAIESGIHALWLDLDQHDLNSLLKLHSLL